MPTWLRPPRHNDTLATNTATADACIQDFCAMQCFSYAIRSQSVLTTIQLGVSTVFRVGVKRGTWNETWNGMSE